jgi:hypothetical protein
VHHDPDGVKAIRRSIIVVRVRGWIKPQLFPQVRGIDDDFHVRGRTVDVLTRLQFCNRTPAICIEPVPHPDKLRVICISRGRANRRIFGNLNLNFDRSIVPQELLPLATSGFDRPFYKGEIGGALARCVGGADNSEAHCIIPLS